MIILKFEGTLKSTISYHTESTRPIFIKKQNYTKIYFYRTQTLSLLRKTDSYNELIYSFLKNIEKDIENKYFKDLRLYKKIGSILIALYFIKESTINLK